MSTIISFDYGKQRTGIAIGNTITSIATPHTVLQSKNSKPDWDSISQLIKEWRPSKLVVGLPLLLDGKHSEITQAAERFSRQLEGRYQLPVDLVNEQLSSREAEQRLAQSRQQGRNKKISKEDIDKLAAAIILESWFSINS